MTGPIPFDRTASAPIPTPPTVAGPPRPEPDGVIYLSRLTLNLRSRAVRRDLADSHALHRSVMTAFPDLGGRDGARAELGVLFRLELVRDLGFEGEGEEYRLLVQSRHRPDWARLPDGYLRPDKPPETKPVEDFFAAIRAGDVLRFRLRANPTKRVHARHAGVDRLAGKRVALLTESERQGWLVRQGARYGFAIERVDLGPAPASRPRDPVSAVHDQPGGVTTGYQPPKATDRGTGPTNAPAPADGAGGERSVGHKGRTLTFGVVVFDGVLRVVDADAFRAALAQGIGSGKAYGFGLLSVAPVAPGGR